MAWQTFLLLLVATMNNINAQIVPCTGSGACSCPNTAPTPGATCILDCATEDICKGKVLNCRTGDPCEILCEAKASCSAGVRIYSNGATDVSIVCSSEDACKDDMEIFCGTGHCRLQCDKSTSCEDWGFIDVSLSKSFFCVGACPNNLPPSKTVLPSITPTNPTINPTKSPTLQTPSPSVTPTRSPTPITISPTTSPTDNPTASPTNNPTNIPTPAPTNNPTQSPTNYPTVTPTKNPTLSPSYNPTNVPTVTPTDYPTLSPSYSPTHNSTVTLSSETVKPTEYPTSLITTQTLLPTLNPSESSTESTSASTSTIEPNLTVTVTLSDSDANPIRAHQSATNGLDTMSAILIVLAVGFAIISAILGWLLCSKDKQSKHKKLKVFQGGHVSRAGEASHKSEFSACPSKSPSTYTKSIKSVYSTNDPRLCSVLETGGSNEGSSESSSSDDMYRNKAEQCGGFPVTGQDSVCTPYPPAPIHSIAADSTRGYIHAGPQQYYYTVQPYVHDMIQHHNNAPLHKAPSLQSSVGVSYSYNYVAGMQSIVSPISPISPAPDLPSISRYDENGDILPVIPGQTERDIDSDADEYSHASVTSDAASNYKLSSNSVKDANHENVETVVSIDLDGIGTNKLYAE